MLPVGADEKRLRSTCLDYKELMQAVDSIKGKVLVFIDACHSGNIMGSERRDGFDINALVNKLASTSGAFIFSSCMSRESSFENSTWKHGAFTLALMEGLNGKALISGKNKITVKSLDLYISERVLELTKYRQHTTLVEMPNVPDFTIAVIEGK